MEIASEEEDNKVNNEWKEYTLSYWRKQDSNYCIAFTLEDEHTSTSVKCVVNIDLQNNVYVYIEHEDGEIHTYESLVWGHPRETKYVKVKLNTPQNFEWLLKNPKTVLNMAKQYVRNFIVCSHQW